MMWMKEKDVLYLIGKFREEYRVNKEHSLLYLEGHVLFVLVYEDVFQV